MTAIGIPEGREQVKCNDIDDDGCEKCKGQRGKPVARQRNATGGLYGKKPFNPKTKNTKLKRTLAI